MMKTAAILALLSASASAFAPSVTQQKSLVSLNAAERSLALPFMNRPALVSPFIKLNSCWKKQADYYILHFKVIFRLEECRISHFRGILLTIFFCLCFETPFRL